MKVRARFSKAQETFRARKAISIPSVSQSGEVYTAETSCMKGTFVHTNRNRKVRNFAAAFRVRKLVGTFEKQAPGL